MTGRTSPESSCATRRLFTTSTNSRGASNTRTTFSSAILTKRSASRNAAPIRSYPCTCGREISCHAWTTVRFPSWTDSCGIAPCIRVVWSRLCKGKRISTDDYTHLQH